MVISRSKPYVFIEYRMHNEATQFTLFVKRMFPQYFQNTRVHDVGSGDINGNNRHLFPSSCSYTGNDVYSAKNVDIVCKTSKIPFANESLDVVVSTECFEHDPEYNMSFQKIVELLKPGGLFFFTCASTGRPEHGTRRTTPRDSYGTIGNVDGFSDYYKNLTIFDVKEVLDIDSVFSFSRSYYNGVTKDLYFIGIKRGGAAELPTKFSEYTGNLIVCTS